MNKVDAIRLRHMLEAASEGVAFAEGRNRQDLDTDRMFVLALMKCIEIIGEAAAKVSQDERRRHPEVPWADVVGMRNRLIHVYFDINHEVLWQTVTGDLPQLVEHLERALGERKED